MKVLVLTDLFPTPQNPNHGIFIYQWAFHLAKMCDMTVYQIIFQEIDKPTDSNETAHFREIYPQNQPFVWIQRIKTISRFDRIWRRSRQFYRQVESDLAQSIGEFDIIIGQMGCPGGYAAVRLAQKFGKKSIVGLRGSDVNLYFSMPILKHFIRRTLINADQLVTVSAAMKAELIKRSYPESKISVVYNGVDEALFHPLNQAESRRQLNLPSDRKILLFIGTLSRYKGIDLLLSAFQALDNPEIRLIFIGQGGERQLIEDFITEHSLQDRVLLAGAVPHSQLQFYYAASDVVVLPSLAEGVPNVILEALAMGKPVVASNVGGIPEIIIPEITGLLHQVGSANDLKDKIADALNYSWDSQTISQSSRRFSWESNSQQYLQIAEKLLNFDR
ncbi:MAG: glycosyltransferase [Candidatus Marinimicrobia bacterium]|nr:glycosyltransferase [Candidatus Neomarinimicrobiota bacterium]